MQTRLGFSPVIYRWRNFLLKEIPSPHGLGGLSPMGYAPGDSLKITYFSDLYNFAELFLYTLLYFTFKAT